VPIRDYKNAAASGRPFPSWQHMKVQGTLWNADGWATQGGRVKTDWKQAPFYAHYRNFQVTQCRPSPGVAWCGEEPPESTRFDQGPETAAAVQSSQQAYLVYDYCRDPRVEDRYKEECS
jgi:hypothetical protein